MSKMQIDRSELVATDGLVPNKQTNQQTHQIYFFFFFSFFFEKERKREREKERKREREREEILMLSATSPVLSTAIK